MRNNKVTASLVLAACLVPAFALAGNAPKHLPKKVKDLHCVIGTWKAKGTIQIGKDKYPIKGKATAELLAVQLFYLPQNQRARVSGVRGTREPDWTGNELR